jgi:hypothetical protein
MSAQAADAEETHSNGLFLLHYFKNVFTTFTGSTPARQTVVPAKSASFPPMKPVDDEVREKSQQMLLTSFRKDGGLLYYFHLNIDIVLFRNARRYIGSGKYCTTN